MAHQTQVVASPAHSTLTNRSDYWWLSPLLIFIGLVLGFGYLTWASFNDINYAWGPYVSPIYHTPFVPSWWKISPAFLLLWIPAGFRLSCYYGRRIYYRALLMDPAACAVGEPLRHNYKGESSWPLVLQNIHRYFLYFAIALTALHWYELIHTFFFEGTVYIGVGTLLILTDTLALTFYVFGCHSLRNLVGGNKRKFSKCGGCPKLSFKAWKGVSFLNHFHGMWFWISLFSIALADLYIRLLAMGIITSDLHISF